MTLTIACSIKPYDPTKQHSHHHTPAWRIPRSHAAQTQPTCNHTTSYITEPNSDPTALPFMTSTGAVRRVIPYCHPTSGSIAVAVASTIAAHHLCSVIAWKEVSMLENSSPPFRS
jgi:hypothetical protein